MTWLDRFLRDWRMRKAVRHVPQGSRVLDIGTYDGLLFARAGAVGVGIDPDLSPGARDAPGVTLVQGAFPQDLVADGAAAFDAATALAVIEHVPEAELADWSHSLAALVRPGGRVVITVPSPAVDHILHVLMRLRLVAGMQAHQHHGFEPGDVKGVFAAPGWHLERHQKFQLGLNHLFVFRRTPPR